ncbi:MAG: NUDIX hydrolase [Gammaproteobacteria bacterium]|nr:NUDIX hydrolase [Gammaproteobacteria bacterium]MCY4281849.1 NUDIX hydrolase [Gammaproteobacteria bacterium]MCY4338044.1 NUDIX hydrolase [Gammaproteobacteria bacterium]
MNYCSSCGARVALQIPPGDNRPRHVCVACGMVHYQNPKIVAGCIPVWEDKVLLCKRAIEPRHGYWTLPAGFMELDETCQEAALRETLEEANARVEIINLFAMFSLPHVSQVYLMFNANLMDLDFAAGDESLEVALFTRDEIPWEELAFTTIRYSLKFFFADRDDNQQRLHTGAIVRAAAGNEFLAGPKTEY